MLREFDVTDVGHIDWLLIGLLLLLQGIVGQYISFPFVKEAPVYPRLKEIRKEALVAPSLIIASIQPALIIAVI